MENILIRLDLSAATVDRFTVVQKLPITMEQVVCTALGLLILSGDGKVYTISYNDQEPVSLVLLRFKIVIFRYIFGYMYNKKIFSVCSPSKKQRHADPFICLFLRRLETSTVFQPFLLLKLDL